MNKIYTQHWIELPKEVRQHLALKFGLKRTGLTEVRDQTLISDGTTNEDLANVFTHAALNAYIGSEETFAHAWEVAVSKAKFEIKPPTMSLEQGGFIDLSQFKEVSNEEFFANKPDTIIIPKELEETAREILGTVPEMIELPAAKWCYFCDSKGIRHKSNCTKPGVVDGFEKKFVEEDTHV